MKICGRDRTEPQESSFAVFLGAPLLKVRLRRIPRRNYTAANGMHAIYVAQFAYRFLLRYCWPRGKLHARTRKRLAGWGNRKAIDAIEARIDGKIFRLGWVFPIRTRGLENLEGTATLKRLREARLVDQSRLLREQQRLFGNRETFRANLFSLLLVRMW